MSFHKVAIIGCGQIGSSVALSLAAHSPETSVIAYDLAHSEKEFLELFKREKISPQKILLTSDIAKIEGAELVILATPVSIFGKVIEAMAPYVTAQTLFTDVGSVKALSQVRIRKALDSTVGSNASYVPFHILNGNAGSGPLSAGLDVFKAPGVIVPGQASKHSERLITGFWQSLGVDIYEMSAETHDLILGTNSHLEHVIMFSWMQTRMIDQWLEDPKRTDPGNWIQAMTRIADAGADMWLGNFKDNQTQILKTAARFRHEIVRFVGLSAQSEPVLRGIVNHLHGYAQDKVSARVKVFEERSAAQKNVTDATIFAALLSLAIAANVAHVEEITGQPMTPIANPSLKDGLGPLAVDPTKILELLTSQKEHLLRVLNDFLDCFDQTIAAIKAEDTMALRQIIETAGQKRHRVSSTMDPGR